MINIPKPKPKPIGIRLKDLRPYAVENGQFLSSENLNEILTNHINKQNEKFT